MNALSNARHWNEDFADYRARQKLVKQQIKQISRGIPATHAKDGTPYTNGSHPTHRPRQERLPVGVGGTLMLVTIHFGTLIKQQGEHCALLQK